MINDDTIIFAPNFNELLDLELINKYKNLIFSDYALNVYYDKSHFIKSLFNQEINNLPNSLTHLTFGSYFNQKINNLPNSLTHLTFGYNFNKKV